MAETLLIVLYAVLLLLISLVWYQSRQLSRALSRTQGDLNMQMALAVNTLDMANLNLVSLLREQIKSWPIPAELCETIYDPAAPPAATESPATETPPEETPPGEAAEEVEAWPAYLLKTHITPPPCEFGEDDAQDRPMKASEEK